MREMNDFLRSMNICISSFPHATENINMRSYVPQNIVKISSGLGSFRRNHSVLYISSPRAVAGIPAVCSSAMITHTFMGLLTRTTGIMVWQIRFSQSNLSLWEKYLQESIFNFPKTIHHEIPPMPLKVPRSELFFFFICSSILLRTVGSDVQDTWVP